MVQTIFSGFFPYFCFLSSRPYTTQEKDVVLFAIRPFLHHLRKSLFDIPFIPSSPSGASRTLSKGTRSDRSLTGNHLPPTERSHHTASVTGAGGPVSWLLIFPPLYPLFPKARPLSVQFSGSRSGDSYVCRRYLSQAFVNTVFRCLQ